ncbi:MAG: STAS domain-containing protein [Lachnospiraceae bacterium]|nr:STAS domain-containing protein [Lachnospiraceae bacterium]
MLNISKETEGTSLKLSLEGRLDTQTAPELDSVVTSSLEGITELIFDIKDLQYISSAGLRVLLATQKSMNNSAGRLIIRNVSEEVKEIFDVTGFSSILTIE